MQPILHVSVTITLLTLILIGMPNVDGASENENNDGNITWADLPEGTPYSAQSEYDEGSFPLPTTWDMIDRFLKLISPAPPPYELINDLLGGEALDVSTLTSNVTKFQGNLMGFAICFVLGALFVVIFPIVCLCFCCCRCCNNCGGKMYQEQSDSDRCKRVCFAVSLVIVTAVILGGIGTAYSVNIFISTTVDTLPEDIIANIDDLLAYVNNTLGEITFLVDDQLSFTLDELGADLEDIGTLVGEPVRDDLNANVGPALDAVDDLADAIDNTYNALNDVSTTQTSLEADWATLETDLEAIKNDIDAQCGSCAGCCTTPGGGFPAYTGLVLNADYRDVDVTRPNARFPQAQVDSALGELQTIRDQDLRAAADVGRQSFNDIPETLKNTTEDSITDILNNLDKLQDEIPKLLNETTSQLSGLEDVVGPIKDDIGDYGTLIQEYDMYRVYAVYALYAVFCLIVVLNILGMMCGWCGYDRDATPTLRGGVSNCGGLTLMSAVGISMLFATFYMFFTSLTFIIGGPIDRLVCDPLVSREIFTKTIDQKDAIIDGYYLGDTLFQNSSIELTVTGVLEGCEENRGVYDVLKLSQFFDVAEFLNFEQFIPNIDQQFDNIAGDFSNIDILTDDTRQMLEDFKNSGADDLVWTPFTDELQKDLTLDTNDANDLSVYAGELRTWAGEAGLSSDDQTAFEGFADDLDALGTSAIRATALQLVDKVDLLETYTSVIDTNVDDTITEADNAQTYIDGNVAAIVSAEITSYSNRILGYPEQFVTYALDQVTNEVGKCKPIANLWNSATRIMCRNLLESFNAIWFTLGWCTVFLMPSIIFGVKLAKHYRIMDYEDSYDDYLTPHEMEMAHMNQSPMYPASNKVAPGHV